MDTICINIGACEYSAVKSKRDAGNCECEHWCEHYEDSEIAFETVSHYLYMALCNCDCCKQTGSDCYRSYHIHDSLAVIVQLSSSSIFNLNFKLQIRNSKNPLRCC